MRACLISDEKATTTFEAGQIKTNATHWFISLLNYSFDLHPNRHVQVFSNSILQ